MNEVEKYMNQHYDNEHQLDQTIAERKFKVRR